MTTSNPILLYATIIVIKSFSEQANGSTSFEDAMSSESSNNIYAEIFKESPSISDNDNNVLTVSGLNFLFTQGGTLNVDAHYTMNGVSSDSEIKVSVLEDQGAILSALSYDGNGKITTLLKSLPGDGMLLSLSRLVYCLVRLLLCQVLCTSLHLSPCLPNFI